MDAERVNRPHPPLYFEYLNRGEDFLANPPGMTIEEPYLFARCRDALGEEVYMLRAVRVFDWDSLVSPWEAQLAKLRRGPNRYPS
jgi:hypothetical protein